MFVYSSEPFQIVKKLWKGFHFIAFLELMLRKHITAIGVHFYNRTSFFNQGFGFEFQRLVFVRCCKEYSDMLLR